MLYTSQSKVIDIRACTAEVTPPTGLPSFGGVTEVTPSVSHHKQTQVHRLLLGYPPTLLKTSSPSLVHFLTTLINKSLQTGELHFKAAAVAPLLKKPNLD